MWNLLRTMLLGLFKILFKGTILLLFLVKIFPLKKSVAIKVSIKIFGSFKEVLISTHSFESSAKSPFTVLESIFLNFFVILIN